jgi:AcrR family transcriptional regulator
VEYLGRLTWIDFTVIALSFRKEPKMPRMKRSHQEIDSVKEKILKEALELIIKEGLEGFSLRKLGPRLGIAPKTIYNYFRNKDEIHLIILTRGFEELNDRLMKASSGKTTPLEKLTEMMRAYFNFAFDNPHVYNIMFTWPVPRYRDLVVPELRDVAQTEFLTFQKTVSLMTDVIKQFGPPQKPISDEEAKFHLMNLWCTGHGYLAGCLNSMLDYLVESPIQLRDIMLDRILYNFKQDMMARTKYTSARPSSGSNQ